MPDSAGPRSRCIRARLSCCTATVSPRPAAPAPAARNSSGRPGWPRACATAPKLASFLNTQLSAARIVVVDLDGVEFLGSAGLSALFEANELAARESRALRLVCHSRIANRALEATELRDHFTFADTVPDALKSSL